MSKTFIYSRNKNLNINKYISIDFVAKKDAIEKDFVTIDNSISKLFQNK